MEILRNAIFYIESLEMILAEGETDRNEVEHEKGHQEKDEKIEEDRSITSVTSSREKKVKSNLNH